MSTKKQKSQAFTFVNMYPTNLQGKNTGPAQQFKCKIDSGAGANLMSLDDYKKLIPQSLMRQETLLQVSAMTKQL